MITYFTKLTINKIRGQGLSEDDKHILTSKLNYLKHLQRFKIEKDNKFFL